MLVVLLLSALSVLSASGYHTAEDVSGRRDRPPAHATYTTQHGHDMPQQPHHDCFVDVLKVCAPHSELSHRTWQRNQAISRLYRCMQTKRAQIHRTCHHFVDAHVGCVSDIERLCPDRVMEGTLQCIEANYAQLSHGCKQSSWYQHQFLPDHHRKTPLRHTPHEDDEGMVGEDGMQWSVEALSDAIEHQDL